MIHNKSDWGAEKTQYGDVWYIWISGGRYNDDNTFTASFLWPQADTMHVPQKVVMMSVAAFAEMAHFSELGRKAALTIISEKE